MELKVGKTYTLNEDIKTYINLKENLNPQLIRAGTECILIEKTKDFVTIDINGLKVRTEDHMLD